MYCTEHDGPYDIELRANGGWDLWARVDDWELIQEEVNILKEHGFDYRVFDKKQDRIFEF